MSLLIIVFETDQLKRDSIAIDRSILYYQGHDMCYEWYFKWRQAKEMNNYRIGTCSQN